MIIPQTTEYKRKYYNQNKNKLVLYSKYYYHSKTYGLKSNKFLNDLDYIKFCNNQKQKNKYNKYTKFNITKNTIIISFN